MNGGSLHTRSFTRIHLSVFRYRSVTDELKMALRGRKLSGLLRNGLRCTTSRTYIVVLHCYTVVVSMYWLNSTNSQHLLMNARKQPMSRQFFTDRLIAFTHVTQRYTTLHNYCYKVLRGVYSGGNSQKNWVGVCGPLPINSALFMTKICDFPLLFMT